MPCQWISMDTSSTLLSTECVLHSSPQGTQPVSNNWNEQKYSNKSLKFRYTMMQLGTDSNPFSQYYVCIVVTDNTPNCIHMYLKSKTHIYECKYRRFFINCVMKNSKCIILFLTPKKDGTQNWKKKFCNTSV